MDYEEELNRKRYFLGHNPEQRNLQKGEYVEPLRLLTFSQGFNQKFKQNIERCQHQKSYLFKYPIDGFVFGSCLEVVCDRFKNLNL